MVLVMVIVVVMVIDIFMVIATLLEVLRQAISSRTHCHGIMAKVIVITSFCNICLKRNYFVILSLQQTDQFFFVTVRHGRHRPFSSGKSVM